MKAGFPAVVAALPEELRPLLRRARVIGRERAGAARCYRATLGGLELMLAVTGDGRRLAGRGLEALLARFEVDWLLILGIAGGLSPGLEPGRLVAAREVRDSEGPAPPPDAELLARALALERVHAGTLVSAPTIVSSREEKARLWAELGADGPALVDLETATWARLAGERGLPYLAVRAVSDPAEESLPLPFERWLDDGGHLRRSRVVLHALRHPGKVGALLALERRVRSASESLAAFAEELLTGRPPTPRATWR